MNNIIENDSTGEKVYVSCYKMGPYFYNHDSSTLNENRITRNGSWIIRSRKKYYLPGDWRVLEFQLSDTNSSRLVWTKSFYKNVLRLTMKRLHLYFLYKQLIYLNKSKLNYSFLRLLKKHLETIYKKNVELNLINLKRFYLNSDILFESIKLKLTRNKRKMRKIFNKIKDKVKVNERKYFLDLDTTPKQINE